MQSLHILPNRNVLLLALSMLGIPSIAQQFINATLYVPHKGLSQLCTDALNASISCPAFLGTVQTAHGLLTREQLDLLCTPECSHSIQIARSIGEQSCTAETDTIFHEGVRYPATWALDRLDYALRRSCIKDTNTGEYCNVLLQDQVRGDRRPDDLQCSDCVLGTMALDLSSPLAYSNLSAQNFEARVMTCGTSNYTYQLPRPYALNVSPYPTVQELAASPTACPRPYAVQEGDNCNSLALAKNVSTWNLAHSLHIDIYCNYFPKPKTKICLPRTCKTYLVKGNEKCEDIAAEVGDGVTPAEVRDWNPNIDKTCGNIKRLSGTIICVSPLAGADPLSPESSGSGKWLRYPANVRASCIGRHYQAKLRDTCTSISAAAGTTLEKFFAVNPDLAKNHCATLKPGQIVCIPATTTHQFVALNRTFEWNRFVQERILPKIQPNLTHPVPMTTLSYTATQMFYTDGPKKGKKIPEAWPEDRRGDRGD